MLYKVRHLNAQVFRSAIRKQNAYLSQSRVIPIQGISEEIMFSLENDLLQIEGVTEVLRHRATGTQGRWSILTTEAYFKTVTEIIKRDLVTSIEMYATQHPPPDSFPPPSLAFKGQQWDEDSQGSFNTYLSACSSIFSLNDVDFSNPPPSTNPSTQAWGPPDKIPTSFNLTADTQVESGVSQDEFEKVN